MDRLRSSRCPKEAGSGLLRASVSVTGLYGTSYAMKFFSRKSVSISFMTTVLPSREEAFRIKGIVSRSISAVTIRCTVTRDGYYSGIFPSSTTTSYMRSPKGSCLNCLMMTNSSTGCSLLYLTVSRLTFLICRTRNMRPAWRIRSTSLITGMFRRIC